MGMGRQMDKGRQTDIGRQGEGKEKKKPGGSLRWLPVPDNTVR